MLAQGMKWGDMSFSTFTKTYQRSDASHSQRKTSCRWETKKSMVVRPSSTMPTLEEEFCRAEITLDEAQLSISTVATNSELVVHELREDFMSPSSHVLKLHPDLQRLCEGDEDDLEQFGDYPEEEDVQIIPVHSALPEGYNAHDEEPTYSEWDGEAANECLRSLFRPTPTGSVVLESLSPQKTPHIVITPCEDTWDQHTTLWLNRVDPQALHYLNIPPQDISEFILHPHYNYHRHPRLLYTPPPIVFSRSTFDQMINNSSVERLVMFQVVLALRKRLYKETAFQASQKALTFRQRYDAHMPFECLEKPFCWTDPAEPLLKLNRRFHASIIIDSPSPFSVPHIVITNAPPENPWIAWSNKVNNPQDSGFGQYLVVPARGIEFINEPEDAYGDSNCWSDSYYYEDESTWHCDDEPICAMDSCGTLEESTTSDSEDEQCGPETPTDVDDLKATFERALEFRLGRTEESFSLLVETEVEVEDDVSLTRYRSTTFMDEFDEVLDNEDDICGASLVRPSCQPMSSSEQTWSSLDYDDEEDDLPPLDDEFYQSVIRRTQEAMAPS